MAESESIAVELYYDGAWHDLVTDDEVFTAPIVIQRGQGDESKAPRPCQITMQLDNRTDKYRPTNPESPLYGKAGRNTPLRVKVDDSIRGIGEASSWECDQSRDFREHPRRGRKWTDVQAGGLLERINGWTLPLRSPFRYHNDGLSNIIGYWPGEQDRGSTALTSTITGTVEAAFRDMAPDSQYRPPGSGPLLDFGSSDSAELGAYFVPDPTGSDTAGWQMSWAGRYGTLAAGEQDIFDWETVSLTGVRTAYGLYLNPTTGNMLIYASRAGVSLLAYAQSYLDWDFNEWTMFSVDATYSGGTTTIFVNFANGDGTATSFISTSFAGSPHRLDNWNASRFSGVPDGSTIGHVIGAKVGSSGGTDLYSSARRTAFAGHPAELAGVRFGRLCDQFSIGYYVGSEYATSALIGPQQTVTLADQFTEIATTDDGLLYDHRSELKIFYKSRQDRYRQTATTIYPEDLPWQPKESFDNSGVANIVTVSQVLGGDYTATDSTSSMGTQDPPDGIGEKRRTVDVNMQYPGSDGPQEANWWLRRGTVDLPRFPQLTVNLGALDAERRAAVEAIDVGDVIEIPRLRENTIRLHVLGYTETIRPGDHGGIRRTITFVCRPDQQFQAGEWDATDSLWDLRTCTLSASAAVGVTTLTLAITADEAWSSTSAFDLLISGELVGVPVGGAGARGGSAGAYTQTLTGVTRSKNGIRKTLPSGSEVRASDLGRWVL